MISTPGLSGPLPWTTSWWRATPLTSVRRHGCGCSSTWIASSTRIAWAPGWRRPRGTSACAAWRHVRGSSLARTTQSSTSAVAHEPEIDERLLAAERAQVVRDALSSLPRRWQRLLEMLMADPPASYADISDELELPIGSIGPTRGRCLDRLRVLLQASLLGRSYGRGAEGPSASELVR